jgi:hypothetical protein
MTLSDDEEEFVQTIESVFRSTGTEDPFSLAQKIIPFLAPVQAFLMAMRSREALREFVHSWPAKDKKYLPVATGLFKLVPSLLKKEGKRMLQKVFAKHPIETPVGRPRLLTEDTTKSKLCDEVAKFHRQGVSLLEAQRRAGRLYGVSTRSAQRAWKDRRSLNSDEPQTMKELFSALRTLGDN